MASTYSSAEREQHGRRLAKARADADELLRVARVMARSAHAEGVPQTRIAEELGVDRMTIRKWVGKR